MAETPLPLPAFTSWDTFPFEGDLKVKALDAPVDVEPARKGEEIADCKACQSGDDSYIWVNERWRVRSMDRPTGLPMILILEPRSHLDIGDLSNLLAAELGVMTVRVERAIRSLDDVARVHVNRWGDGAAHLHLWFMARPKGQLQLRGSFLPMWDDILPPVKERKWREDLALVAAWLAEFGGTALAQPPRIEWQAPSSFVDSPSLMTTAAAADDSPATTTTGVAATDDAPSNTAGSSNTAAPNNTAAPAESAPQNAAPHNPAITPAAEATPAQTEPAQTEPAQTETGQAHTAQADTFQKAQTGTAPVERAKPGTGTAVGVAAVPRQAAPAEGGN